jgi:hypothetical protein
VGTENGVACGEEVTDTGKTGADIGLTEEDSGFAVGNIVVVGAGTGIGTGTGLTEGNTDVTGADTGPNVDDAAGRNEIASGVREADVGLIVGIFGVTGADTGSVGANTGFVGAITCFVGIDLGLFGEVGDRNPYMN